MPDRTLVHGLRFGALPWGEQVAWTHSICGRTDGISAIHRVGEPNEANDLMTLCGDPIPGPRRHFPALRSLDVCGVCENRYHMAEAQRYRESA